ncbi:hypothetical protein PAEPH01_2733 [Pancytospora epiphaga]|nr:hypothetical protein PAEPH01_2733 [Pancytospora epiphaga]
MKTRAYKALRACVQLISAVYIVVNILGIFRSVYYYYLWPIESEATTGFIITYYTIGLYSLCANIILGLFSSCGVTNGSKFLMRMYIRIVVVIIVLFAMLTVYFRFFYIGFYSTALGSRSGHSYVFSRWITGRTGIQPQEKAILAVKGSMEEVMQWYTICQIISIVCNIFLIGLMKYTVSIDLWAPDPCVPSMINVSRRGMNTSTLKNIRVIDVVE